MRRLTAAIPALALFMAAACTQVDCPVENTVATSVALAKPGGGADTLKADTLTVTTRTAAGRDTTLLNRLTGATAFTLPISSGSPADTLFILLADTAGRAWTGAVVVEKTDRPHFESVDCAMAHFHTITAVEWDCERIDSVAINKPEVNYDSSTPHLLIYLNHPRP